MTRIPIEFGLVSLLVSKSAVDLTVVFDVTFTDPCDFGLVGLSCSLRVSWTLQWILVLALWTSFHDAIYLLPYTKQWSLPLKN